MMSATSARVEVWRLRLADLWSGVWRWVLLACGLVFSVYLLLEQGVANGELTAAALGLLVVGAALTGTSAMAIPLLAMPAVFVVQRVGVGGTDLSVSDVALAAAFGTAVLLCHRPFSGPLRQLLWLNLIYQAATLFTVVVNPYAANTIEWFHAWLLISGALVVGWALGRAGKARIAFILMLVTASLIAAGTVVTGALQYAHGDFGEVYPAWPFPMHKNAAGTLLAFVALIAHVHPDWAGLRRAWTRPIFWLLVFALVMTQSRQAIIGLVVAIIVLSLRRSATRRVRTAALLAVPAIWLVVVTVIDQIESQNRFNSFFQRVDWLREVYAFWKLSPVFGHGLRYWYTDVFAKFQPPQAEVEVVASAGVVGLAGFLVMWVGVLVVLWRVDPRFGSLAFAVVLCRIVQSQFDLFWVAGQASVPFVIAGICLGALARENDESALIVRRRMPRSRLRTGSLA